MFFITFYLSASINYRKDEKKILFINIMISVIITVIYGFISYFFGVNLFKLSNYMYPGALGRIRSTFFNPCYYAAFINLVFSIFFYKLCISSKKNCILYLVLLSCLYACMIFTFTRSSVLIFLVLLFMSLFLFRKIIFKLRILIIIMIIIVMSIFIPGSKTLMKNSINDGMLFINNIAGFLPSFNSSDIKEDDSDSDSEFNDYSLQHREAFARMAKTIAKDNIFTGVGFGSYIDYMNSKDFDLKYPSYQLPKIHPHSSLILLYAETGIFTLIPFILFLCIIVFKFCKMFLNSRKTKDIVYYYSCLGLIISAGFIVVSIMSENSMYDTQIFPLYLIICGLLYNFGTKEKSNYNRVMFISSTGGHFSELSQLKSIYNDYDYMIVTEKTKSTIGLKEQYDKRINYLVFGTKDHKLSYPFKFIFNCFKSLYIFLKFNPNAIVTTGTHTAVPMCYIGKIFGCKIIFIETFANSTTRTLTGRLIYPIADTFIVQWESMLKLYPKAKYFGWIY